MGEVRDLCTDGKKTCDHQPRVSPPPWPPYEQLLPSTAERPARERRQFQVRSPDDLQNDGSAPLDRRRVHSLRKDRQNQVACTSGHYARQRSAPVVDSTRLT